jgi:ribosomal protein S2
MIGYFMIYKSPEDKYAGGLMTLNDKGLPINFKYTEPIKPSKIQKIIYGNNLKSFLASEIIGKKILEGENDIDYFFIDDNEILDFIDTDKLLVYIKESYSDMEKTEKENETFINISDKKTYKLIFSKKTGEDLINKIKDNAEYFNLSEPFIRLKEALEFICSSNENQK